MNPNAAWSGRRVQRARAVVQTWLPTACGKCGHEVGVDDAFVVGHRVARAVAPELTWTISNWQAEHAGCSDGTGQAAVIERAKVAGARELLDQLEADGALFPATDVGGKPPTRPFSLPGTPRATQQAPIEPREGLDWHADTIRTFPWLADLADVPDDAAPPLWMSLPSDEAVCSYGWDGCTHLPEGEPDAVTWIETTERKRLRWWQRLAVTRQLEHRDDGSLTARSVVESCPRRAGKSVRMRGVALWRMMFGERVFGEVQTVVHTGSDVAICREIQRGAWRWAQEVAGWEVKTGNGKELVESGNGDRWLVRAQPAVYGYDVTLGIGDECWDVLPATIDEGLEPATLERFSAQIHLTSTAHRRATSLMRGRISTALITDDNGETLLMVWAAPLGADTSDPAVWRAASPHWSTDRARMISGKYAKALAGEADPDADDPDPMAGFLAQYVNQWRLTGRREAPGTPVVNADQWLDLTTLPEDRTPDQAVIESWFAAGVSLALAWREGQAVIVSVSDHRDVASAVAALRRTGYRGRTIVGKSLATDPALRGLGLTPNAASASATAGDLARLIGEGRFLHDGGEHLAAQVLDLRTQPGVDGPRIVSRGRADAAKAATWAAIAARARPYSGTVGVVLPSGVA